MHPSVPPERKFVEFFAFIHVVDEGHVFRKSWGKLRRQIWKAKMDFTHPLYEQETCLKHNYLMVVLEVGKEKVQPFLD